MNQGQSIPNQTENLNTVPLGSENLTKESPEVSTGSLENVSENVIENQPSSVPLEQPPQNTVVSDAPVVAPVNDTPISDSSLAAPAQADTPIVNDVVESKLDGTWVEKAEDIIKKDKDDPYQEEEDHEDLQEEYLKQRFGKNLKSNDLKD